MPRAKNVSPEEEVTDVVETVVEQVEEVEQVEDNLIHIRLKKAQMLIDESIGIKLNALINKTSCIIDKTTLRPIDRQKLMTLVGSKDIEVYDPNVPELMIIPEYVLDLSDTVENKFLNNPQTTEKQVLSYIKAALNTPRAARIPLKVLYKLETLGQNRALKPRLAVVEAIVDGLSQIGIPEKEAELTPVEKDKLMDAIEQHARNIDKGVNATMSLESDEVLTSVQ